MEELFYNIRQAEPEDAAAIVRLFREIYGEAYPHADMYCEETLRENIRSQNVRALLGVDADGRAQGYFAREQTAPNQEIWEEKGLVVTAAYKRTQLGMKLMSQMQEAGFSHDSGVFSFPVCYQYFSQLACVKHGRSDVALCLEMVDASIFKEREAGTGRVACLLNFSEYASPEGPIYLPEPYDAILRELAAPLQKRVFKKAAGALPSESKTVLESLAAPEGGNWSLAVREVGADWSQVLSALLAQACRNNVRSWRVFVNAHQPSVGAAVEQLRQQGFFFCGLAPQWFGSDGIVLQKLADQEPDFEGIRLYSRQARELCSFLRADREAVSIYGESNK
jgi:hypothetical protein